ncbi:MAG TPA: hypothetical protein VIM16_17790 [Mucilaginibacter sp.]|jgi:hypothetical protein
MNKYLLVFLAFPAICFMGCKDEAYKVPPPSPANSYFPQTLGSTWTYRDSIYGEKTDTANIYGVKIASITYTITGSTTDFNSAVCYDANVLSALNVSNIAYFYANKQTFGLRETTPPFGFTYFEFLTDTAASVGYSWTCSPTGNRLLNGDPIQSINTVREKNITKVVGGKTFTNVIHTSANFQIQIDGVGFHNIAYYDFYLAKGVGLIEKDTYAYGNLNAVQTIMGYTIK